MLDELVDADDSGTRAVTRRDAWTRLLVRSRDYLQSDYGRGHAPNQDLADQVAATFADVGLATLSLGSTMPRSALIQSAYQASGVLPAKGEGPGWGWWFSDRGISMEPNTNVNGGFSAGYGDEEWALGTLAMLTGDPKIVAMATAHVSSFAKFRHVDNARLVNLSTGVVEATARTCRVESVITWRHNKNPGTITYGGGDFGSHMAVVQRHPISIRLAQLKREHGWFFTYDLASPEATASPHWPEALARASIELETWEAVAAIPPADARLPMEAGEPDFVFGDTQSATVALKHGTTRMFVSLQWRHGYLDAWHPRVPSNVALNNVARVHLTDMDPAGSVDRIINAEMDAQTGAAAGWARLYSIQHELAGYAVAMNLGNATLTWTPPASMVGADAVNLADQKRFQPVPDTIAVPPRTTVVLFRMPQSQ